MTQVEALLNALDLQVDVGRRVRVEQLEFASPCDGWTVRDVMSHSISVTRKFTDFASGATDEPHAPPGDHVGSDHRAALRQSADNAASAWGSVDMSRSCRLPFGTFSADTAAGINLFDVLAHTWDIATAIDVGLDEDDELWLAGLDSARSVIGPDRDPQHYAPEVSLHGTARSMMRFLAYLGRSAEHP